MAESTMMEREGTDSNSMAMARATPWWVKVLAVALLFQMAARILHIAWLQSATSDELFDVATGHLYLRTGDMPFGNDHAPLPKIVAALPLLPLGLEVSPNPAMLDAILGSDTPDSRLEFFGCLFFFRNTIPSQILLFLVRSPGALWACIGGAVLFLWAQRLAGWQAALIASSLYTLCPNLIAHSSLATADVPLTVGGLVALYLSWSYAESGHRGTLVASGILLGLAAATKFSGLILLPVSMLLMLRKRGLGALPAVLALIPLAAIGVLLPYGFVHVGPLLQGINSALAHPVVGHNAYFLGEYSSRGWISYYAVALLLKTPLPTLMALLLAAGVAVVTWLTNSAGTES